MNLQEVRKQFDELMGEKTSMDKRRSELFHSIRGLKRDIAQYEEVREIIRCVAQLTQSQLEYHVSELTSLALASVFPEPYKLKVEFNLRRNRTEADIMLESSSGMKIEPMTATGGGVVDMVAFGLRLSMWSIRRPKLRNVIVLDEPFRFLSKDLQNKTGTLLQELSKKLGIQFIIVSHESSLIEQADKVFEVQKIRGISRVMEVQK